MTETGPSPSQDQQPSVPTVVPTPGSRLDDLAARHDEVKKAKRDAADAEEGLVTAIKAELARLHPEATQVVLSSPWLPSPLTLLQVTSWRFDAKRCRRDHPEIYAALAKQSTSWTLRPMGS